jgi:glycosyltransferase involved in cell wall biosynthesis
VNQSSEHKLNGDGSMSGITRLPRIGFVSQSHSDLLQNDRVEAWMRSPDMMSRAQALRIVEKNYMLAIFGLNLEAVVVASTALNDQWGDSFLSNLALARKRLVVDVNHLEPYTRFELRAICQADLVTCGSQEIAERLLSVSKLTVVVNGQLDPSLWLRPAGRPSDTGLELYKGPRALWLESAEEAESPSASAAVVEAWAARQGEDGDAEVRITRIVDTTGKVDDSPNADGVETIPIPIGAASAGYPGLVRWLVRQSDRCSAGIVTPSNRGRVENLYTALGLELLDISRHEESDEDSQIASSTVFMTPQDAEDLLDLLTNDRSLDLEMSKMVGQLYDGRPSRMLEAKAFRQKKLPTSLGSSLGSGAPLVSILIPAYNRPEFLREALNSALFQSYPNIEVIVGDDSTDDRVEKLIRAEYLGRFGNLRYWHNAQNRGQFQNDLDLISAASGEFINILMDDDILRLDKIERQMKYFMSEDGYRLGLVTSHRAIIDEGGSYVGLFGTTPQIFQEDVVLAGADAVNLSLQLNRNIFGEPTTVLFRRAFLQDGFGYLYGRRYVCNVDQASWYQILGRGDAVFINDSLSAYRKHDGQQSWTPRAALGGAVDFAHATLESHARGYLAALDEYEQAIRGCVARLEQELTGVEEMVLSGEASDLRIRALSYLGILERTLQALPAESVASPNAGARSRG